MNLPNQNGYLVQSFQSFYEELLRQKERALRESEGEHVKLEIAQTKSGDVIEELVVTDDEDQAEKDIPITTTFEANLELAQNIQRRLRILLEEQALKSAHHLGDFAQSHFKEAQYLMVAIADEVFLTLNWPGQRHWERHLLETQLFQSQVAGESFFDKLDFIISNPDPMKAELAILYLYCLSLGFKGKYRGIDDQEKIQWYKKQLFTLINHRDTDLFLPGRKYLFNNLYDYTLSAPPTKGLPDVKSWVITFVGVATVYLFITYVLWYKIVRDLDDALQLIFDQARMLPL
jgi:type VI secretion system protein ImpK